MIGTNASTQRKLSDRQLDLIVRAVEALPMLPATARALLALVLQASSDDGIAAQAAREQAVMTASLDVSLSALLISQANKARPGGAATVAQAVEQLGFDAVRVAVLSANLSAGVESAGLNRAEFLRHCLAVAIATRALVDAMGLPIEGDEAFACGLLHDIGKLAMDASLPKSYARVIECDSAADGNIAQHERQIIGTDHNVFGRRLAEHWRLTPAIVATVWLHHQPAGSLPESLADRKLVAAVGLADAIARRANIGFSGNHNFDMPLDNWASQLGLNQQTVEQMAKDLPAMTQEKFNLLWPPSDTTSTSRTAQQAASELTQLNEQLRRTNIELAGQARGFGRLTEFIASLKDNPSVGDLLPKIAATAADSLGITAGPACPIIAYCVDPADVENAAVLAVRYTGQSQATFRTLARVSLGDLPAEALTSGSAISVAEAMLAQKDALDDWADLAGYLHYPLTCADRCVGGIFCPSVAQPATQLTNDAWVALAGAMAMALSNVQDRWRAIRLSEQLAASSSVLMQTSQELAEARTLGAIGEMASGAAHEMNNPLAVMSGRAQIMRDRAVNADDRKAWQSIVDQSHRVSDIITELMEFASPAPPAPKAFDVGAMLRTAAEAFSFSNHTQAKTAQVDIEIGDQVPPAWADASQVQAAVVELISNAVTAAGAGACVKLNVAADEPNHGVLLTVQDNGPGMDERTLAKAFTPFFSQQRSGRRRGLGLPRAKRAIESNGGRIWIQSSPPAGTKVFVLLPTENRA